MKKIIGGVLFAAIAATSILFGTGQASAACLGTGVDDVTGKKCITKSNPGSVSPESTRDKQRTWIVHDDNGRMRVTNKDPNG